MSIRWLLLGGQQTQRREDIAEKDPHHSEVMTECYCQNGHSILKDTVLLQGSPGLTLKLRNKLSQGVLVISPFLGDQERTFVNFEKQVGEVVDICCPTCFEPFPQHNVCRCGAHLFALFTSAKTHFPQCLAIWQRPGCLHSKRLSERDLRLDSRQDYL